MDNGLDPCEQLVEIGPKSHSISGGIRVDEGYQSNIFGLYAAGEACGGVHGACRCAGNAASQAVMSGLLCAESIKQNAESIDETKEFPVEYKSNKGVYEKFVSEARATAADAMGIYRNGPDLESAQNKIEALLKSPEIASDTDAGNTVCAMKLIIKAALERRESRGVHLRTDYPNMSDEFNTSIVIKGGEDNDC